MSGHSKWANIKHKKAAMDAKRGKIFSKLAREIMIAAKQGGGDPEVNMVLRALIQKAKSVNMPAENVERAIKKGTGELDAGAALEEVIYEAFAPGGVGLIIQVLTDNRNRSAAEVRHVCSRHNINLGSQGSVSRNFRRKGWKRGERPGDQILEVDRCVSVGKIRADGDGGCVGARVADHDLGRPLGRRRISGRWTSRHGIPRCCGDGVAGAMIVGRRPRRKDAGGPVRPQSPAGRRSVSTARAKKRSER